jgi:hypothetical protein
VEARNKISITKWAARVANIEQELTSSSFFESAMAARRRPPVDDLN